MQYSLSAALVAFAMVLPGGGQAPAPGKGTVRADDLPVAPPSVTLPAEIRGLPGQWIVVAPTAVHGGTPKWKLPAGLTEVDLGAIFPPEMMAKAKGKVVTAARAGFYVVQAWNARGDVASDLATCVVVVGTPPTPPPDDDTKPPPDDKAKPVVGRLHVVVVEETSLATKGRGLWFADVAMRAFLSARKAEWRVVDKDGKDAAGNTPADMAPWIARASVKAKGLPYYAVADDDGTVHSEGPLPATPADMLAILRRLGE